MELDRDKLQREIHELYRREHEELGEAGTMRQLEEARQWDLSGTLSSGGVIVFPHAGVQDCGHQIAVAVNAALDSGADKVIVISVLHAFTQAMQDARVRVANGGAPSDEIFWGIQGPGIEGERQEWRGDHALISWRHFWEAETKRRGVKGPEVIERYPYLAGGKPQEMPGFEDIAKLADDAVIVSTADAFHHGLGYGDTIENSYNPDEEGLAYARKRLMEGVHILEKGDYWGYNGHCVDAKSDARDAGQLFRYLRGPMKGKILDLVYTDASELYGQPKPTWVAGALYDWQLTR